MSAAARYPAPTTPVVVIATIETTHGALRHVVLDDDARLFLMEARGAATPDAVIAGPVDLSAHASCHVARVLSGADPAGAMSGALGAAMVAVFLGAGYGDGDGGGGGDGERRPGAARMRLVAWAPCFDAGHNVADLEAANQARAANPAPPDHFPATDLDRWLYRPTAGRQPGYQIPQFYGRRPWKEIADQKRTALADPVELKVYYQQVLAQAFEGESELPKNEELRAAADSLAALRPANDNGSEFLIPVWACLLIGSADVQGDRLEWAAYAYGPGRRRARIAKGVIMSDPGGLAAWNALSEVAGRRFAGEACMELGFDAFGVDTGGNYTMEAYAWCAGRQVYALKGKPNDPHAAPLERSNHRPRAFRKGQRGGRVNLWLVGTRNLKISVLGGLRNLIDSAEARRVLPGALVLPSGVAEGDVDQFLAEELKQPKRFRPGMVAQWERRGRMANEQLDLAVYADALAIHHRWTAMSDAEWAALFTARARPVEDPHAAPMEALWAPNAPPDDGAAALVSAAVEDVQPVMPQLAANAAPARKDALPPSLAALAGRHKGGRRA